MAKKKKKIYASINSEKEGWVGTFFFSWPSVGAEPDCRVIIHILHELISLSSARRAASSSLPFGKVTTTRPRGCCRTSRCLWTVCERSMSKKAFHRLFNLFCNCYYHHYFPNRPERFISSCPAVEVGGSYHDTAMSFTSSSWTLLPWVSLLRQADLIWLVELVKPHAV